MITDFVEIKLLFHFIQKILNVSLFYKTENTVKPCYFELR